MANDNLDKIVALLKSRDSEMRVHGRKAAREMGLIVDSTEDLVCEEHQGSKIIKGGFIPGSYLYTMGMEMDGLGIYFCDSCNESMAYDCPNCGIVVGDFKKVFYRSQESSWVNLAGREGEHYHCRLCNIQIGEQYFKFS